MGEVDAWSEKGTLLSAGIMNASSFMLFWMYWTVWFHIVLIMCVSILCQAVYSASFPEDIPTNKGILTVGATDADSGSSAEIQYSLFGIGVEDFYMDANTGKCSGFCMI